MVDKIYKLKKILSSGKHLLIFNHFNPDPDSLTAALILSEIAKHFKVKTKIVYSGEIAYNKNLAMMNYLHLKEYPYTPGEERKFDLIATVDTQKGMSNNAIPEHVFPHLTFDHHPRMHTASSFPLQKIDRRNKKIEYLYDVRTHYGSAASILLEYYLKLGLKLTTKIATAFCYTILAETNYFTRKYNGIDVYFYRKAVQIANLRLISKIENTKRPAIYFQALNHVIHSHQRTGNLLTCPLGKIESINFLHEIANFMLTMEGVEFVALTGISEGGGNICCRSTHPKVHLGNALQKILEGKGSGGGHMNMAAGKFMGKEETVIRALKSHLKKVNAVK